MIAMPDKELLSRKPISFDDKSRFSTEVLLSGVVSSFVMPHPDIDLAIQQGVQI